VPGEVSYHVLGDSARYWHHAIAIFSRAKESFTATERSLRS
jgi:hypothetical protein